MLLIITACVKPSLCVKDLALRDETIRLRQYIDAMKFFLEQEHVTDIIFCDNSNADFETNSLYEYAKIKNKNLEILKFQVDDLIVSERGKSYGEFCIMDFIMEQSTLIMKHNFFLKITGRLIVQNFEKIVKKITMNNNYFVCLGNPIDFRNKKIDTRFYGMRIEDYSCLREKLRTLINESAGYTLEKSFYKGIEEAQIQYRMLPYYPQYKGISGSTGINYTDTKLKTVKFACKNFMIKVYVLYKKIGRKDL